MKNRAIIFLLFSIILLGSSSTSNSTLVERTISSDCTFDTYVSSSNPDTIYGNNLDLKVNFNSSTSSLHYTYLSFSVNSLPFPSEVLGVKLSINITSIIPNNDSFYFRVWETSSFKEGSINWENKPNSSEDNLVSVGTITELGRYECFLSAAHHVRENGDYYLRLEPFNSHGEILIASRENGHYSSSRLEISYESMMDEPDYYSTDLGGIMFFGLDMIFLLLFFAVISIVGIFLFFSLRSQRRRVMQHYTPRHPSVSTITGLKYCFNCGMRISSEGIFCPNCGTKNI